jgi:GMP synthase-like glutamine amidotransferase
MTIGILLCGDISATLQADFGPYSSMIRRLLGSRSATVFNVQNGQLPRSISDCEAYVITGSAAGVYDGQRWINDLMTFLRSARRGDSKLIGICFGHQAMAKAFGALSSNRRGAGGRSPPLRVARAAILDR